MKAKVAFIGLGNMGAPMAKRLIDADFQVTVYSKTPASMRKLEEVGANRALDINSAVSDADYVLTSLPTPLVVRGVYLGRGGIVESVESGTTVIDLSTIDPQTAVRISTACRERGVSFLDAPVSGGVQRAAEGTLSIMVGGEAEAFDAAGPVLGDLGTKIVHVGPSGYGQLVKLSNNMIFAITQVALGEVLVAGAEAGLSTETMFNVLSASSADSFVLSSYFPLTIFTEERPTLFSMDLMAKDVGLFLESMGSGKASLPLSSLVQEVFRSCQGSGLGSKDSASVVEFYESVSQVRLKIDPP